MPQSQTPRILACLRAVQAFIHKRDRGTGTMVEQLVRRSTCRQGRHLSGAQAYRRGDGRVLAQRVGHLAALRDPQDHDLPQNRIELSARFRSRRVT